MTPRGAPCLSSLRRESTLCSLQLCLQPPGLSLPLEERDTAERSCGCRYTRQMGRDKPTNKSSESSYGRQHRGILRCRFGEATMKLANWNSMSPMVPSLAPRGRKIFHTTRRSQHSNDFPYNPISVGQDRDGLRAAPPRASNKRERESRCVSCCS